MKQRKVQVHTFQPTQQDRQIIAAAREKTGVNSVSDIFRMSLRALAEKLQLETKAA